MKRLMICLALLAGCAAWNRPINESLSGSNAALVDITPESIGSGELYVGLAFSGGGMRASAFAYGMLEELRATNGTVERKLGVLPPSANIKPLALDEKNFRWQMNEDAMATEKLAEGIRQFTADGIKLDSLIQQARQRT